MSRTTDTLRLIDGQKSALRCKPFVETTEEEFAELERYVIARLWDLEREFFVNLTIRHGCLHVYTKEREFLWPLELKKRRK